MKRPHSTRNSAPTGSATGSALRAAAQRRVTRQATAVADTVRAWQALREAEAIGSDTQNVLLALRAALDNLQHEMEN